jgi:hypothetical protein
MPMLRFDAGTAVMSFPSLMIFPEVGGNNPIRIRRIVVLPHPEGPRSLSDLKRNLQKREKII